MDYKSARSYFGDELDRKILEKAIEQCKADGCVGCAYIGTEEWQDPCRRCQRNCKDYWRRAVEK